MADLTEDPAAWADRLLALKHATPFRAFTLTTGSKSTFFVSHPDEMELTGSCVEVDGPDDFAVIELCWVVGIELGAEAPSAPRAPRYALKLQALQEADAFEPLVLTLHDGRQFQ